MIYISIFCFLLGFIGTFLVLDLKPQDVVDGIMGILSPKKDLRANIRLANGKKKDAKLFVNFREMYVAFRDTHRSAQFALIVTISIVLAVLGAVFAVFIGNNFLIPVAAIGFACIPISYGQHVLNAYKKETDAEIEKGLTMISTSYLRNSNIIDAVRENLPYIKSPVHEVFRSFLGEVSAINPDVEMAINRMKQKLNNPIFDEWCEMLVACQTDPSLAVTLLPIVKKLASLRILNSKKETSLIDARYQFWLIAGITLVAPWALSLINASWSATLFNEVAGQVTVAIVDALILVFWQRTRKLTSPQAYR